MNTPTEKDAQDIKTRLQTLGFEQIEFESKNSNRFIARIKGFPSYVIKAVELPQYTQYGWVESQITLTCYNPSQAQLEVLAIELIKQPSTEIQIQLLTPTAHVDTEWKIVGSNGQVSFGKLDWSDDKHTNLIYLTFKIESAEIHYP